MNSPASPPAVADTPVPDTKSAISPLRWIFWGALICLIDLTYSKTVNGVGWKFDFANDAVGVLIILWGTSRLARIRVHDRYRSALRFVKITAVFSLVDAIHAHFIYDTPAAIALFFSLVNAAEMVATVVFCVAMRWLGEAAGLQRSAKSWKITTLLFVIIYLIPLGSLSCAAAIAIALRSPFHLDLGPAGLWLMPVFAAPLIHFFVSTTRMKADAQSPAHEPPPHPPQASQQLNRTRRRLVRILAMAGVVAVVGLFALLYYRSQAAKPVIPPTVQVDNGPYAVAVDPGTRTVYVTNTKDNTVSVIDGKTRTVTATVFVGDYPTSVAVDPSTHTVYVANLHDSTVSVIDGNTHVVTATVNAGKNPVAVAVDPATHTVYVANYQDVTVSVIDGYTNAVTATVKVGPQPSGVAVDPGTHSVYVTNFYDGTVSVIDGSTRTVTATLKVGEWNDRQFNTVAVDAGTHSVYVANLQGGRVSVIDGSTHKVTATIDAGKYPNGVAVDPDTHTVYVTNSLDNKVSVIDGSTHRVIATIPVGRWPDGVAVDPATHTVYVANNSDDTVSVIERR
ncbi:YncE family protein [Mycobacterium sp. Z3061]|uniref:YncE family protein n=1 Tax=Mycobacterium sp. Z3061 TaxID=3073562 RepID=UPI0028738CB6|nr:YncE family protein [Mycobacterium sp. Z3061]